MKYLIVVGDGMGDEPLEELGGRTPLQAARTPHIQELSRQGQVGTARLTPEGMLPGSDVAHLSMLGYDPKAESVARAPLEAASLGIAMAPIDVAYRCNLVTFRLPAATGGKGGYDFDRLSPRVVFEDYSAGYISTEQARELILDLNDQLGTEAIQFYPGLKYRHLMIWIGGKVRARCRTPQEMADQKVLQNLPEGDGDSVLKEIMASAVEILCSHPINEERRQEGLKPANGIWLWGQGKPVGLTPFARKHGLQGAVVAAVDVVKGLGGSLGMEVVEVPGATGDLDTDFAGKAEAALKALEDKDLVLLHVEAPDEAGHQGDWEAKVKAIEDIDREVVGRIVKDLDRFDALRLLLLCDHSTSVKSRRHLADPVPWFVFEKSKAGRIKPGGRDYDEASAASAGRFFENGTDLLNFFLKG